MQYKTKCGGKVHVSDGEKVKAWTIITFRTLPKLKPKYRSMKLRNKPEVRV